MYLFVYGTLLTSIPSRMSKFLRRRARLVGKGTVAGTLYDLGQYPGLALDGSGGRVKGELYALEEATAAQTLELLDSYEGVTGEAEDEYRRSEVDVRVEDGGPFTAFAYSMTSAPASAPEIPRGDYGAFYRSSTEHQRFVNGE